MILVSSNYAVFAQLILLFNALVWMRMVTDRLCHHCFAFVLHSLAINLFRMFFFFIFNLWYSIRFSNLCAKYRVWAVCVRALSERNDAVCNYFSIYGDQRTIFFVRRFWINSCIETRSGALRFVRNRLWTRIEHVQAAESGAILSFLALF